MLGRPVSSYHTAVKSDSIDLLQAVSLAPKEEEPLEQQNWGFVTMYPLLSVLKIIKFWDFTASKCWIVLFRMPLCHNNQVWPPLAELGLQEIAEHCPQGYLWCQCSECLNLWSEPELIHVELDEDCPGQWWDDQSHPKHAQ